MDELSKKQFLKADVSHRVFGDGQIVEMGEELITVQFTEHGEKQFMYPDAFKSHLELSDETLTEKVKADFKQKQVEERKKTEALIEAYEEAKEEAKKKKRTTRRKKTTKKTTAKKKTTKKKTSK